MVTANERVSSPSVYVAPLSIIKEGSRASSRASSHTRNTSSRSSLQTKASTQSHSHMTPPTTPNGSQEDLLQQMASPQPVFHNFLRAFYPFHPARDVADSTVTLPLNEGDVVLVHSIHTNGWADGTLLLSGARGWLPTNYCEGYEPEAMQMLLKALLNFWDLLRSGLNMDNAVFGNQDFMKGIIAGVRFLLEKTNCLTREAPLVKSNDALRRSRKGLLSDLSGLVKTAKRLQEFVTTPNHSEPGNINNVVDEMILKAFRIVTRGVKFLETLEADLRMRTPIHRAMSVVAEETDIPPTPPAESTSFNAAPNGDRASDIASRRTSRSSINYPNPPQISQQTDDQTRRLSFVQSLTNTTSSNSRPISMSRPASVHIKRQSISHRLSLNSPIPAANRQNLVSERLSTSHDTFLSFLGSFIGRLHLQSHSSTDLIVTVQQSITAGGDLLTVVEAVSSHDQQSASALDAPRGAMYDRINHLAEIARDILRLTNSDEDDFVTPEDNNLLLSAATGCVMAAGECVSRTKTVIEKIGDFEFEATGSSLDIDIAMIGASTNNDATPKGPSHSNLLPQEPSSRPPPPPLLIPGYEKPLPEVPADSPSLEQHGPPTTLAPVMEDDATESATSVSSNRSSRRSILPPLAQPAGAVMTTDDYSSSDHSLSQDHEFQPRAESIAASSTAASSTYVNHLRDSEASMMSATSTRATTPENSPQMTRSQDSFSDLSMTGSHSTLADDPFDVESQLLEKTFAHELLYNKEGQITGGTLPALVERLTTHDSTPDSMFVSTFYLTFRLFATPTELAQALVDRFDYVAESPHIAGPVRLRVYNVFKGWLETHWRGLSDHEALSVIETFAQDKLGKKIPGAGKRLLELTHKVSSSSSSLVPRQVSSMGKTSTSIAPYVSIDTPLPPSVLTKSQSNALRNWKMGGSMPTILDFEPLEIARQLTIKEMNIFCAIMPEELLGSEWTKKSGSNAVNVRAMSTLSTDLSNLVADTILHYDDVKKRAVVIKQWVKIAHRCLELNNYDSLMAIICSLNSSTIVRLKRTWDCVSPKRKEMLRALQAVVEPDKNYANLRKRLQNHVPPCLPFVGTYLTDLTFVDAGNLDTKQLPGVGEGEGISVINFDKHARTAKIIGELQRFQIPYRLTEIPEVQEWIQAQIVRVKSSSDFENVQQYYRKSLLLEPRETLPRPSPIEPSGSFSAKEKFDLFSWTHSKEKSATASASSH